MNTTLLCAGLACVMGAIVGGGLKAFGIEFPVLQSGRRQALLAAFGVILLAIPNAARVYPLLVRSSPAPKIVMPPQGVPANSVIRSSTSESAVRPDPSLATALLSPNGLPGGASGIGYWPARFTFYSVDKNTGRVIGKAEWWTSGAVARIEGTLSGKELTITDGVAGNDTPGPHHIYKFSPEGEHRLVGNWFLGNSSGPAWIILDAGSSNADLPIPASQLTHGFEFQLKRCLLSEYTLVCDLAIVNRMEETQFTLGSNGGPDPIEAYDDSGNHFILDDVQLANESPAKVARHFMISATPTPARLVFLHFNGDARRISLLRLPCFAQSSGGFVLEFREIPLQR